MEDQRQGLRKTGLPNQSCRSPLLFWKFPHLFLPHIQVDLPSRVHEQADEVIRCAKLWADSRSYAEYLAQIRWRLFSDFECLAPPERCMYFHPA